MNVLGFRWIDHTGLLDCSFPVLLFRLEWIFKENMFCALPLLIIFMVSEWELLTEEMNTYQCVHHSLKALVLLSALLFLEHAMCNYFL